MPDLDTLIDSARFAMAYHGYNVTEKRAGLWPFFFTVLDAERDGQTWQSEGHTRAVAYRNLMVQLKEFPNQ